MHGRAQAAVAKAETAFVSHHEPAAEVATLINATSFQLMLKALCKQITFLVRYYYY